MARGWKAPLRINSRGGCDMTDDNLEQLLAVALLPGDTTNPWNPLLGIGGANHQWTTNDAAHAADIRSRVEQVFARLEQRGRARLESVQVEQGAGAPTRTVVIRYERIDRAGDGPRQVRLEV